MLTNNCNEKILANQIRRKKPNRKSKICISAHSRSILQYNLQIKTRKENYSENEIREIRKNIHSFFIEYSQKHNDIELITNLFLNSQINIIFKAATNSDLDKLLNNFIACLRKSLNLGKIDYYAPIKSIYRIFICLNSPNQILDKTEIKQSILNIFVQYFEHNMDNILKLIEVNPNYIMIDIDSKIRNNFGIFINNLKSVTSRIIGARYPHLKSEKGLWSQNYFVVSIVNQEIINIQQKLTMECTQERNICLLTTHENYSNEDIQNYLKKNIS